MNLDNKKDEKIINNLLKILDIKYECHKYFNDGASSRVILLNNSYLIKQNTKPILQAEVEFLKLNNSKYFQKIVYIDPDYEFVVYNFINGEVMKQVENVEDTIQKLVDITSKYEDYLKENFGYLNEEVGSWSQFLKDEIKYSSNNITKYISDLTLVNNCISTIEKYPFKKKLLHGDFGTHNFIKQDGKLIGVIDPMPVIGDPLYDLLFAIVSNTDILSNITLEHIYSLTTEPKEKIKALLIIVLYSRISRCLKYNPNSIDIYMNFWYTLTK